MAWCVIARPSPLDVHQIVYEVIDLVCTDTAIFVGKNVHDDSETVFEFPDRGAIVPSSVISMDVVRRHYNVDSLGILLEVLTIRVRIGRVGPTHVGEGMCERYQ